jgi:hypothetical protein
VSPYSCLCFLISTVADPCHTIINSSLSPPLLLLTSSTSLHHNNSSQVSCPFLPLLLHQTTSATARLNQTSCSPLIINLWSSRSDSLPPPRLACNSAQFQSVKPAANATAAPYLHSASGILHSTSLTLQTRLQEETRASRCRTSCPALLCRNPIAPRTFTRGAPGTPLRHRCHSCQIASLRLDRSPAQATRPQQPAAGDQAVFGLSIFCTPCVFAT